MIHVHGGINNDQKANPKGEIINATTSSNRNYDNFIIFVNVTVKNIGDAGKLKVWTYVRQGTTDDGKNQNIYFESGETKDVSFAFSDVFKYGSSWFHDYGIS
jgi:hypothetical protein